MADSKIFLRNTGYIADDWSAISEFEVGDIVLHNNILYRCNIAHTRQSTFDASKFSPTTIGTEFNLLRKSRILWDGSIGS